MDKREVARLIRVIATESIRSSGQRLVLGKPNECIQNALDYGGFFIDVGQDLLRNLIQAGIDPGIIYIEALKIKLEAKIPRVDFINIHSDMELNKKVDNWYEDLSVAIQQLHWMQENAHRYGYHRDGDSWILIDNRKRKWF